MFTSYFGMSPPVSPGAARLRLSTDIVAYHAFGEKPATIAFRATVRHQATRSPDGPPGKGPYRFAGGLSEHSHRSGDNRRLSLDAIETKGPARRGPRRA